MVAVKALTVLCLSTPYKGNFMIKKLLVVSISLALSATASIVHAETASKTEKVDASACAGCHGADGNSAMPTFPKLAGQHASYLAKQLHAFKSGQRDSPMMSSFAQGLDDDKIQALAEFYAAKKISENAMPVIESDDDDDEDEDEQESEATKEKAAAKVQEQLETTLALGEDLYRNGDLERKVSACIACHGPFGEGNKPAAYPNLKGQHADYLIKTLMDFKKGTRDKSPDSMMNMIAKKMTEEEIKAVSYHISIMK